MHYLIISGSPQSTKRSTSAFLANVIKTDLSSTFPDTADIFYLSNRSTWDACRQAFYEASQILFVLPVYVEGVPCIVLEFLDTLDVAQKKPATLSFLIQGGFEEASQLRTAERFLSHLPDYFHCSYGGTLIKGGLFGLVYMRNKKYRQTIASQLSEIMESYKKNSHFDETLAHKFAGKEYYSKKMIMLNCLTKPLNRLAWNLVAKRMGATDFLANQPYDI